MIGLGKLGSAIAAVLATRHDVIGYDALDGPMDAINRGDAPVEEPGLQALIDKVGGRTLRAGDLGHAVHGSDVAFVVVPTPSDDTGRFDNRYVLQAVERIGYDLRDKTAPYTVVIVSTVMPGSCAGPIKDALEQGAGRRVGDGLSLNYVPAFIALGSVIHDFTHPDMLLIGCDDPTGAAVVTSVLTPVLSGARPVYRMSLLDAELAKLSLNVALSIKVAMSNEVAQICERIGGDAEKVLAAVGGDSRIGAGFLQPGPTASGPCLSRDLVAFDRVACDVGRPALVAGAAERVHRAEAQFILGQLLDRAGTTDPVIGILGASYKVGSHVTDESVGVRVAARAVGAHLHVVMHDPRATLPDDVTAIAPAQAVIESADVILIATPWPEYRTLDYRGKPVIDLWGIAPRCENVHRFGVAS